MWAGDVADAFDGDDMFAVDGDEGGETGVDGGVVDFLGGWVEAREDEGAGAAAAFGAAAGGMLMICRGYKRREKKKKKEEEEEEEGTYSLVPVRPMPRRYSRRVASGSTSSRTTRVPFR